MSAVEYGQGRPVKTSAYRFETSLYVFRIIRAKMGWVAQVRAERPKRWLNVLYPNGERANRPLKREMQDYLLYAYGGK